MNADDARAWYRLGNQHEDEGRDAEALACFERAVTADPGYAKAWNNLGAALQRQGHASRAEEAYRTALRRDPALLQPSLNLGRLHESRGESGLAAECYRGALAHHPGEPILLHLLAAASGGNTERAPREYVESLFDEQAMRFDARLVGELEYRVPEQLAALVRPALLRVPARILDLGCGTGLVGAALGGAGVELTGVDLSAGMLREAAKRGMYRRLQQQDVQEALAQRDEGTLDAIVAADVFIYIGALDRIFVAATRALAHGGVFAFSVETLASGSYQLQPSGRYAHALDHLGGLASVNGLEPVRIEATRIRRQGKGYAGGSVLLFRKA